VHTSIGKAGREHFGAIRAIELAAFETLFAVGAVSGQATASTDAELQTYLDAGFLYAAFDDAARVIGYGGGYVAGPDLHIGELDVHPDWQRQGIGRRIVTAMLQEARARQLDGVTLTTDRFAPFNAPFYASLGFRGVEGEACPPRLRAILDAEHAGGLDPLRRLAMVLAF